MSSFICAFALILVTCYSGTNNAGASIYHGKSNGWSNIKLIQSKAPWTHFVYMVADNNLDYFAAYNLEAMRLNTATMDELNLVVYIDRCIGCDGTHYQEPITNINNCETHEPISGRFNGSKILQKKGNIWCEIYDFGHELDSMQPETIANFTSLMRQYQLTSTYFMLNFWDHGGAWSGFGSDEHTAMANQNETISNLDELFSAVQNGLQKTFLGRLDILGFDACIMADYSVLHYLSQYDITKYYIASEVSEPGVGWDYTGIDASLSNVIDYSKAIIDAYVQQGEVQSVNAGAGYTLALFDMDKIDKFLNEFSSFIRMITYAVGSYDYGILMSILRGQSSTIAAEKDFAIYDMGLFLNNFINDDNIFWNTCKNRLKISGENVLKYLQDAIIYFKTDFVRKDMTGSTIFYSTSFSVLNTFYYYNNDLISDNYIEFLVAMNESLTTLQQMPGHLTNNSCSARQPVNLSFSISNIPNVKYAYDYGLYKMSVDVTATVMDATTYILFSPKMNISSNLSNFTDEISTIIIAEIDTNIIDKDFDTTELITYWDGKIGFFVNNLNENITGLDSVLFASGQITFSSTKENDIPNGYIIKYPLHIYDSLEDKNSNDSIPNNGYIQFEVILPSINNITIISISNAQLYEIDSESSVISQVQKSSVKYIEGVINSVNSMNTSIVTGTLMWPNFTIVFVESMSGAEIIVSGNDVFGNYDGIGFNIMDINISNWNISIETPSPTI
eukprot:131972_1